MSELRPSRPPLDPSAPRDVAVIGAGVAGTLAALEARAAGASVIVVHEAGGASALSSGVWDARTEAGRAVRERVAELVPFAIHPHDVELVAELDGLRSAAASDPTQLDLKPLPSGKIAVAVLSGHPVFDGRALARVLDRAAVGAGQRRRFGAVEVDFLRRARDRVLHPHELAAELDLEDDDPKRGRDARFALSEAIRAAIGGMSFDAVLVPPILGLRCDDVRSELEAALGLAIGEAVGHLPGAAGARLSRRLHTALDRAGVDRRIARVVSVEREGDRHRLQLDAGPPAVARAIVLATGKRLGGGLVAEGAGWSEPVFGLPIRGGDRPQTAGAQADADGRALDVPAPLQGGPVFACGSVTLGTDGGGAIRGLLDVAASALACGRAASR